jgi:hypothetical protein
MISVAAAAKAISGCFWKLDRITMNSPTKPDVPGKPELAMANSTKNVANHGITFTTPP